MRTKGGGGGGGGRGRRLGHGSGSLGKSGREAVEEQVGCLGSERAGIGKNAQCSFLSLSSVKILSKTGTLNVTSLVFSVF